MGQIEGMISENWQSYLGFFITWVLPFIIVFGAILLGHRLKISKNGLKGKTETIQIGSSSIEVHKCLLEPVRPFYLTLVVQCTIKASTIPMHVTSLRLYVGIEDVGEPNFPTLPITINSSSESFVLKYEVFTSSIYRGNRSYISVLTKEDRFSSQILPIPYDSPLLT